MAKDMHDNEVVEGDYLIGKGRILQVEDIRAEHNCNVRLIGLDIVGTIDPSLYSRISEKEVMFYILKGRQ